MQKAIGTSRTHAHSTVLNVIINYTKRLKKKERKKEIIAIDLKGKSIKRNGVSPAEKSKRGCAYKLWCSYTRGWQTYWTLEREKESGIVCLIATELQF